MTIQVKVSVLKKNGARRVVSHRGQLVVDALKLPYEWLLSAVSEGSRIMLTGVLPFDVCITKNPPGNTNAFVNMSSQMTR